MPVSADPLALSTPADLPQDLGIARLGTGGEFAAYAFAKQRPILAALEPPWVAIGARWRGVPAGLALGTIRPQGAWLHSVTVAAPLRRRGIASALLAAFETEARCLAAPRIATAYSGFLVQRVALEALLMRRGWSPPVVIDITLVGKAGAMADGGGAWRPVQRAMREMVDYAVAPYGIQNVEDEAAIDSILAAAPELGVVDPRTHAALDPALSVMLRHRGALIGWIAGERLTTSIGRGTVVAGAPSVLYSGARLADGHHKAFMLVGYHAAFSRQAELYGADSRAVYRTHPGAAAMYAFTRARFAPMALHVEERIGSSLSFHGVDPA